MQCFPALGKLQKYREATVLGCVCGFWIARIDGRAVCRVVLCASACARARVCVTAAGCSRLEQQQYLRLGFSRISFEICFAIPDCLLRGLNRANAACIRRLHICKPGCSKTNACN